MKPVDRDLADELAFELEIPRAVANVCVGRGLDSVEKVKDFCELGTNRLHSPWTLPDIKPVVARIVQAIEAKEKIFVHGDYDVDGVTATAVVVTALRMFNADISYHVPHRIQDGYDIKPASVDRAKAAGATLMLSVDCGIVAFEAAEYAKEIGMDLIITDHHHPSDDGRVPDCIGVVNPNRHDSQYPFPGLAGVGIAFKVMLAVGLKLKYPARDLLEELVEYVALGTVADVAPMIDENRSLVSLGCAKLTDSKKAGVKELLKVAGVNNVTTMSIGFSLGPRINAVGRLADSGTALDLLLEKSERRAKFLAEQLNSANHRRQMQQEQVVKEALAMVPDDLSDTSILVIGAKGWHPGLVGLVAGKLAENYGRPALVCTIKDDGTAKGSCRSIRSFNILEALKSPGCWNLFTKCGGHAFAAGFELPAKNLDLLREKLNEYAKQVTDGGIEGVRVIEIDSRIQPGEINDATFKEIARLAPFGSDNPEPMFIAKNMQIVKAEAKGAEGKHLKMRLKGPKPADPWVEAMAWRRGSDIETFCEGASVDVVFKLNKEEWQGRINLSMTVEDLRISQKS